MKIDKDNAMLIDIQYVKPRKGEPDYLYIIWKDLKTNEKHLEVVKEPTVEIFFQKPELRNYTYNKNHEFISNLDRKTVKYKDIIFAIAHEMGDVGKQKLQDCFATGNYKALKEFMMYPYVFGADYDIRVLWRYQWMKHFENKTPKVITRGALDIEVDIMESNGDTNPVICPIDLITLIDMETNTSYTFALIGIECVEKDMSMMSSLEKEKEIKRREMYKSRLEQQEYIVNHQDELQKEVHALFDESYPDMKYNFYFYKDERKMLVHLFQLINTLKLDFIQIWNMPFDIPYIKERMEVLGLDPVEIMSHPDFPVKECRFKKDVRNFAVKNKNDWFNLTSYTIFVDQMRNYAAIRKSQQELRSNKLTYIAKRELNDEKLDYSEDGNIKTLSYNNYLKYILYNIKDVLLQCGIENRTTDLETFYATSYKNLTPYESIFKQTVKLRNVQYKSFMGRDIVPGTNINALMYNYEVKQNDSDDDDEDESEFEGALVGNPLLINDFGVKLFNHHTNNIFDYSIDFDMGAFYPSSIIAMNIDPSTLKFKAILDPSQYKCRGGNIPFNGITDIQLVETNSDSFSDDVSKEAFDNFQTGNIISTGVKWMNFPSISEIYNELKLLEGKE